jgi:hypothetical protein
MTAACHICMEKAIYHLKAYLSSWPELRLAGFWLCVAVGSTRLVVSRRLDESSEATASVAPRALTMSWVHRYRTGNHRRFAKNRRWYSSPPVRITNRWWNDFHHRFVLWTIGENLGGYHHRLVTRTGGDKPIITAGLCYQPRCQFVVPTGGENHFTNGS